MLACLPLEDSHRGFVQGYGDRAAILGFRSTDPRMALFQIHLRPFQAEDVALPQPRCQCEKNHFPLVFGKFPEQGLGLLRRKRPFAAIFWPGRGARYWK